MVTERAPGAPNGFNANAIDSGLDDGKKKKKEKKEEKEKKEKAP